MLYTPFYDPAKTYYDNLRAGPFGAFADDEVFAIGEPRFDFLGIPITYPFGIPAGPLLNAAYVKAAFRKGFDVPVYKTVRATEFPCHPFPNVLSVRLDGNLTPERAAKPLVADTRYAEPLSITNSFGVPSRSIAEWQADARIGLAAARSGQVMVMSFMGTACEGQSLADFTADYVKVARAALETGASLFEINLSCPNIGNEGLVYMDPKATRAIARAVKDVIGGKKLILKIGHCRDDSLVEALAKITDECADGLSAINTLQATIVDEQGKQALPGPKRDRSGVCGAAILWAGLETIAYFARIRTARGANFALVGCGGVTRPEDFRAYRDAGADVVMSATGAMWNPYLARDIRQAWPNG